MLYYIFIYIQKITFKMRIYYMDITMSNTKYVCHIFRLNFYYYQF